MLSVLIPAFDTDCSELIRSVAKQCEAENIEFEIIISDDASPAIPPDLSETLEELSHARLIIQSQNLGRSRNRNFLLESAKYKYILFIDGDSLLEEDQYIKNYWSQKDAADVIYGGTVYRKEMPAEGSRLRWNYGLSRESTTAAQRQEKPYISFKTNNFFSTKDFMLSKPFDESITEYGHEDTIFGLMMLDQQDKVLHIDNPVLHDGIEEDGIFLNKTEIGLRTLKALEHRPEYRTLLRKHHRMCSMAAKLNLPIVGGLIKIYFKFRLRAYRQRSLKQVNKLRAFDMYRLAYYTLLD